MTTIDTPLDPVAVRIIGALIEKEVTTPDNYPLTLNSLVAACNQTSNREPVMTLTEDDVARSLDDLRKRSLVRAVQRSDSRTTRYRHLLAESMTLDRAELAVLCVLLLRGAQTSGELNTRSARLYEFSDLAQLERTLELLTLRNPPLVVRLPRRPGQKEGRYMHLFAGEPAADDEPMPAISVTSSNPPASQRIEALEQSVDALRGELAALRAQFEEFRKQFL